MQLGRLAFAAALALALTVSGCGDATGSSTVSVTADEGYSLFADVTTAFDGAIGQVSTGLNGSTLTATVVCNGGGNAAVTGSFSGTATSETFDLTEKFTGCHGQDFTLDGSVEYSGSAITGTSGTITIKGNVTLTGAKAGTCAISLTVTVNNSSGNVQGSVCGTSINAAN